MASKPRFMKRFFQFFQILALSLLVVTCAACAFAADKPNYPTKKIRYIVPSNPGGGWDLTSRFITPAWSKILGGATFEYVYEPAAGTMVGLNNLVKAPGDGYTMLCSFISYTNNTMAFQMAPYKMEDFAFLGNLASDFDVLYIKADDTRWKDIDEFVAYARTTDKPITVGVPISLSPSHLTGAIFQELGELNLTIIPFKSGSEQRNALLGAHVDACISSSKTTVSLANDVRVLTVFGEANPVKALWDVKLINAVAGYEEMPECGTYTAVHVSKKLETQNPDLFKHLADTLKEAFDDPDTLAAFTKADQQDYMDYRTPEECQEIFKGYDTKLNKYGHLIDPNK